MADVTHRKGKFRRSLCGKPVDNEQLTLFDEEVTCEECKHILHNFSARSTQKFPTQPAEEQNVPQ